MDLSAFGVMPSPTPSSEGGFLCPHTLAPSLDEVYAEFTTTIAKRLSHQPYPTSFLAHNPICPLCSRLVSRGQACATCKLSSDQQFLIHSGCLAKQPDFELRTV